MKSRLVPMINRKKQFKERENNFIKFYPIVLPEFMEEDNWFIILQLVMNIHIFQPFKIVGLYNWLLICTAKVLKFWMLYRNL